MSHCECAESFVPIFSGPDPNESLSPSLPLVHHHHHDIICPGLLVSPRLCVMEALLK